MLTLAKRAVEMHALVKGRQWSSRLRKLPLHLFGKTVLIVGFGRIGTRTRNAAWPWNERFDLRSLQSAARDQGRRL